MDNRVQYSFNVTMMNILNIPKNSRCRLSLRRSFNINLFLNTAISAVIFCSAMVAPYFAASFYPEYRMTLGAVGQIINSFGTIVLLFFVDPILYNLMDQNKLMTCFNSYLMGRFFGFCLGGVVLIIFGIFN
jgi:cytochrome c biogenesis protein CcdA